VPRRGGSGQPAEEPVAQVVEAAPSTPLRINFVVFIIVFPGRCYRTWETTSAGQEPGKKPGQKSNR
jgi:hypothetical protein